MPSKVLLSLKTKTGLIIGLQLECIQTSDNLIPFISVVCTIFSTSPISLNLSTLIILDESLLKAISIMLLEVAGNSSSVLFLFNSDLLPSGDHRLSNSL